MQIFDRKKEINLLLDSLNNRKIKIITGIRRCGKTYLLKNLLPEELKKKGYIKSEEDVLVVELKGKNSNIKTENQLLLYLGRIENSSKKYIVIDEVQKIKNYWDVLIKYFKKNEDKEIFVTGSNSQITSRDILIKFQEFGHNVVLSPLKFYEIREKIPFYPIETYLKYGGLPLVVNKESDADRFNELSNIYDEIYEADIIDKIRSNFTYMSVKKIKEILRYIFSTTSELNSNNIANRFLKGVDVS